MERTPSPPRRLHTPPAPLHGDHYEPFSPRRSSRVAAQRGLHHEQTSPRPRRDVTPTASTKRSVTRVSHFALSPPSSPVSPQQHRSPRSTRRVHLDPNPLDSDSDHLAPTPGRRLQSTMAPVSQPTPHGPGSDCDCQTATAAELACLRPMDQLLTISRACYLHQQRRRASVALTI